MPRTDQKKIRSPGAAHCKGQFSLLPKFGYVILSHESCSRSYLSYPLCFFLGIETEQCLLTCVPITINSMTSVPIFAYILQCSIVSVLNYWQILLYTKTVQGKAAQSITLYYQYYIRKRLLDSFCFAISIFFSILGFADHCFDIQT